MFFTEIIKYFNWKFDLDLDEIKYRENIGNFLVCFNCMERYHKLSTQEINQLDVKMLKQAQIEILQQERSGYDWYKCINCDYLKIHDTQRWINELYENLKLAYNEPDKFYKIKAEKKKMNENNIIEENKEERSETEVIPFNEIIFALTKQNKLIHPFKLKSVYRSVHGQSPNTTNHTKKFSGCLDYIFVSDNDEKMRIIGVDEIVKPKNYLPDKSFASDHIPIKMQCEIFVV